MPGKRCPLSSCSARFPNVRQTRRHVYREGHGPVVHCSSCNEPFLTDRDREQHMEAMGVHDKPRRRTQRRQRATHLSSSSNLHQHGPSYPSTSNGLYDISSEGELNSFIADELAPQSAFLDSTSAAVDKIVTFLQNNLPAELRPRRTHKGGSLGKGTALKGKSDIDLTLVIGGIGDIPTLKEKLPRILTELQTYLGRYSGATVTESKSAHAVKVEVTAHGEEHSVDILPALDLNLDNEVSLNEVYERMARETPNVRQFYSSSLSPLQLDVIRHMPTKVKSLIRLVKDWKKDQIYSRTVPTSYVMELVVIHAWQSRGSPQDFNMVNVLRDVLKQLVNHRYFAAEFGNLRKYKPGMARHGEGPYIIDPTNPFNDVYNGYFGKPWDWDAVAREAQAWLAKPLFH